MRCVAGQRGVIVLAFWICFLLCAPSTGTLALGYRSGRYSCCTGCTSCSCTSRGGSYGSAAPGTNCNACASGPGQNFLLQGSACGEFPLVAWRHHHALRVSTLQPHVHTPFLPHLSSHVLFQVGCSLIDLGVPRHPFRLLHCTQHFTMLHQGTVE